MTKRSDDRFVKLPYEVLDSPAFISASAGAKALFVFLIRRFNGRNNGQISCSVREASAWCVCGKSAAARYFAELIDLDPIEPVVKGRFTGRGFRRNGASVSLRAAGPYPMKAGDP